MTSISRIACRLNKKRTLVVIFLVGAAIAFMGILLVLVSFLSFGNRDNTASHATPTSSREQEPEFLFEKGTDGQKVNDNSDAARTNDGAEDSAGSASNSKQPSSSYRPFKCKKVSIPRATEYRNNDSMSKGATKKVAKGSDGYYISCTADSQGYTPPTNGQRVEPVDDVVEVGTGMDERRQQQAEAEQAMRQQKYALNLANCIQSLRAQGMTLSSAEAKCRQIVTY